MKEEVERSIYSMKHRGKHASCPDVEPSTVWGMGKDLGFGVEEAAHEELFIVYIIGYKVEKIRFTVRLQVVGIRNFSKIGQSLEDLADRVYTIVIDWSDINLRVIAWSV